MKIIIFIFIKLFNKITTHIKHPLILRLKFNDIIHKIVFSYLSPYFNESNNIINKKRNYINLINSGIIWMFWWQGISDMPYIVKCCINSVKKHSGKHEVILISKDNIRNYVELPNYVYNKLKNGNITLTHFSDILRFNLLKKYGGLWIDSTMYCVRDLNSNYFGKFYTSGPGGKDINASHDFVSDKWTGFLIGGCKNNPVFDFMDTFFKLYWKFNTYQIDYFMIDYGLYYIYLHNIGQFSYYVNHIACNNNPHLHELMDYLNMPFDVDKFNNMKSDTDIFKLTYKETFNNNKTFYSKLFEHNNYKIE